MKRGYFIVFEGCDHSGKTTQSKLLSESGIFKNVTTMTFPDRTTLIGSMINNYLQKSTKLNDKAIHLLFSANRWEKESKINELLNNGTTIICDRYSYSGIAYSVAKGLPLEWCKSSDQGLPMPDLVIYLYSPIDVLLKRGDFGTEIYENEQFQETVHKVYMDLRDDRWVMVNGDNTIEGIQEEVQNVVRAFISRNQ